MSERYLPKSILPLSGVRETRPLVHPDLVGAGPRPLLGVEQVLAMAAVDVGFAEALLTDAEAAIEASGVALSPSQRALLSAVDRQTLQTMITQLAPAVAGHGRRAFFRQAASVAMTVLAGTAATGAMSGAVIGTAGCSRNGARKSGAQKSGVTDGMGTSPTDRSAMTMREPPQVAKGSMTREDGFGGYGGFGVGGTGVRPDRVGIDGKPIPKVLMTYPRVKGGLDAAAVVLVIRRHKGELRRCYVTEGLRVDPKFEGKASLEFSITPKGQTTSVRVSQLPPSQKRLAECFKAAVESWQFPKPKGATPLVNCHFVFRK